MLLNKNMTLHKDSVSLKPSKKKKPQPSFCVWHLLTWNKSNLWLFVFHFSNSEHRGFNQIKFWNEFESAF